MSNSKSQSSNLKASVKLWPTLTLASKIIMPDVSVPSSNSASEQSMPEDSVPCILLFSIFWPLGRLVPGNAKGTLSLTFRLVAPQINLTVSFPVATSQIKREETWGCFSSLNISPTLICCHFSPEFSRLSTGKLDMVSFSANFWGVQGILTYSFNQL